MHSTDNLDDGYFGSGRRMLSSLKKHGGENHHREIIELCSTREILCEREEQIVTLDLIKDPLCMNLMVGGTARRFPAGQDTCDRMRLAKLGKKQSLEHIAARRSGMMGRIQTDETKEKLRTITKNQWKRRYDGDENAVGKRLGHGIKVK